MYKIELSETLGLKQVKKIVGGIDDVIYCTQCKSTNGFLTNEQEATLLCKGGGGNQYLYNSWLNIMQGPVPTSFDEIGTGFTATHSEGMRRSDDVLISISNSLNNPSGFDDATIEVNVNPCVLNTFFKPAIKSGVATWFSIVTFGGVDNIGMASNITEFVAKDLFDYNPRIYSCNTCYGTIGLIGSGADLEIPDVNVIKDDYYAVRSLKLEIPTSWEYESEYPTDFAAYTLVKVPILLKGDASTFYTDTKVKVPILLKGDASTFYANTKVNVPLKITSANDGTFTGRSTPDIINNSVNIKVPFAVTGAPI